MIIPMKKAAVICLAAEKTLAVESLRELGVLHVIHEKAPENDELKRAEEKLVGAQRALEVLHEQKQSTKQMMAAFARIVSSGFESIRSPDDLVDRVTAQINRNHELDVRIESLAHELEQIEPLGPFDPASVRSLASRGVTIQFYHAAKGEHPTPPENALRVNLSETKRGAYFALIARGPIEWDRTPISLPKLSLSSVRAELDKVRAEREAGERRLQELSIYHDVVVRHVIHQEDNLHFAESQSAMSTSGRLAYLRGFCPADRVEALEQTAAREKWGLLIEDPAEDEQVPTLIRNPKWSRSIKAVFDMLGLMPGYKEVDISAVFLLFFSVFFAMLVGDAGYGLIFLGFTILARRKFEDAPEAPFTLLKILSICTIVWGVATGTYFGMSDPPAALTKLKVGFLTQESNLINLCFLLGAIQLTIAHVWNVSRMWGSLLALDQIGRILLTWTMYFAARAMIMGVPFPSWVFWIFGAGLVLVILFMTPVRQLKSEWYNHVMLPLNIISNFVDVVSYVRLFAVGYAGYAIASNFNEMALGGGVHGVLASFGAALILFLGHALNIVLSCMGVLVHGVRLNALEFSGHLGMQWSGFAYQPFARLDQLQKKGE